MIAFLCLVIMSQQLAAAALLRQPRQFRHSGANTGRFERECSFDGSFANDDRAAED